MCCGNIIVAAAVFDYFNMLYLGFLWPEFWERDFDRCRDLRESFEPSLETVVSTGGLEVAAFVLCFLGFLYSFGDCDLDLAPCFSRAP